MQGKENIAVVILNWNGENYLRNMLPFLLKNSSIPGVEIIIADNGSSDGSVEFLKSDYPEIKLILFDKNYGFAEGYNKALSQICAKYFILLNSDIEVTEGWIQPLYEIMEQNPIIAACMPKIRSYNNRDRFEYAGAAGGFIDRFGYPFCRGRILKTIEEDKGQYNDDREIFWATGACMMIRAELFTQESGFDPVFFAHMEEIDLCWRLKNKGYRIHYTSKSTVYHIGGGTLPNNNPRKLYLNFRNNLLLLFKNLPEKKLFFTIFTRLLLDGMSAAIYLITFKFAFFMAVFKAHISFFTLMGNYNKFRKKNAEINKVDYNEVFKQSIVTNYFLKKNRKFNTLKF